MVGDVIYHAVRQVLVAHLADDHSGTGHTLLRVMEIREKINTTEAKRFYNGVELDDW